METNSKGKITCGVAGVGYLGQHHREIYDELDASEFVGFYEPNETAAQKILDAYACRRFSSLEELGSVCDAVSVVCPTDKHAEVAILLLVMVAICLLKNHFALQVPRRRKSFPTLRKIKLLYKWGT